MPSHIHTISGSKKDKLEDIERDMKKHTSIILNAAIKNNNLESRKSGCCGLWKEQVRKIAIIKISSRQVVGLQQHNKPLEITGQQMFN